MALCSLCALLKANRAKIYYTAKDEAQSHAAQHFQHMKFIDVDSCVNLDEVFKQCFPNFTDRSLVKRRKVKSEGRRSLLHLCRTLLCGRITKASPRVVCQKCGTWIFFYSKGRGSNRFHMAIDHASTHLGLDLYKCRKCGSSFGSRKAVCHHLLTPHRLRALSEYYTDKTDDFIDEITASIKQCFCESSSSACPKTFTISLKCEIMVRSKTKGSKLAVERQLFCYELIQQLAGDDDKITCRLCSKRINVKQQSGFHVHYGMEHVLTHLEKPLYRCKLCSAVHTRYVSMHRHLKSVHTLGMSKNYECIADKFHSEIMNILQKCYGAEAGSK